MPPGTLLAAAATCLLAGCTPPLRFEHGVASGDPTPGAVILWTRVTPARPGGRVEVAWELAEEKSFDPVARSGRLETGPDASERCERALEVRAGGGGLEAAECD